MPNKACTLGVLVGLAALTGCGPLNSNELRQEVSTLHSNAREGALLAHEVAHDRTKYTFVRVHAKELSSESSASAEKLYDADPAGGLRHKVNLAIELANDSTTQLDELAMKPGDEPVALEIEGELLKISDRLERLEEGL
jgi:hypothetical protein